MHDLARWEWFLIGAVICFRFELLLEMAMQLFVALAFPLFVMVAFLWSLFCGRSITVEYETNRISFKDQKDEES